MTSKQMQKSSYLWIFMSYYKPHLPLFILDMVCALAIAGVDLIFPMVSRYSMQQLLPNNAYQFFFVLMACLVGAYVLKAVFTYIVAVWGHYLGVRIEADMRTDVFAHMQKLSFSFYDKNRTGVLMSRVTSDLFEITELAHHGPEDLFISCVTILGAFCIMLTIRWELALILMAVIPLFLMFTVARRRYMSRVSVGVKKSMAGINGEIESSISGMRTAKAFANEPVEIAKFENSNDKFRGAKREYYRAMGSYTSMVELALGLMPVIVIAAGGYFIMEGRMDYIDLMTFSLYVATFTTPVRKLSSFVEQFMQGMAGFTRFVNLMRTEPVVQDDENATELDLNQGEIQIKDVHFSYENTDTEVLNGITLNVKAGETVAVVGPSGGGKSTLCQLIPRFYDVTSGVISIDNQDIRLVTQQSLRSQIGIVQQDVFLFAGTVYDNISYGKPNSTMDEVIAAAKKADIYDGIMEMPNGFDTYVGERGVMLSGGQKQRISIARIFLKDPSILILDEATSALDSVTEARIQSAFDQLAVGRTTLIIAHRLSTIASADRIILVDEHGIKEEGTHEELMALNGQYAKLYLGQMKAHD